jgi:hypothetical protein
MKQSIEKKVMKKRRTSATPSKRAKRSDGAKRDLDSLLKMVDEWKFKLHETLKNMTAEEEAAYWRESAERARAAGFHVVKPGGRTSPAEG